MQREKIYIYLKKEMDTNIQIWKISYSEEELVELFSNIEEEKNREK